MLFNEVAWVAPLAVVLLLVLIRWIRRVRLVASERAWRPLGLQEAELIYVERMFRTRSPIRLVARVDRGYRQSDGSVVLVEFKTRLANRVYFSDVIELSAQRFAVEAEGNNRVTGHGYVLIQQPGSRRRTAHRVKLLTNDEVIALVKRREIILTSLRSAAYVRVPALCRECAFLTECKPCHRGSG